MMKMASAEGTTIWEEHSLEPNGIALKSGGVSRTQEIPQMGENHFPFCQKRGMVSLWVASGFTNHIDLHVDDF